MLTGLTVENFIVLQLSRMREPVALERTGSRIIPEVLWFPGEWDGDDSVVFTGSMSFIGSGLVADGQGLPVSGSFKTWGCG